MIEHVTMVETMLVKSKALGDAADAGIVEDSLRKNGRRYGAGVRNADLPMTGQACRIDGPR